MSNKVELRREIIAMTIYDIYNFVLRNSSFRKKRMNDFFRIINPTDQDTILDVGGYPGTWLPYLSCAKKIDIINIHPIQSNPIQSNPIYQPS
jgi:hypothetical protein